MSVGLRNMAINIEIASGRRQGNFNTLKLFGEDNLTACRHTIMSKDVFDGLLVLIVHHMKDRKTNFTKIV